MVADAVEGFFAEVERTERDVGSPFGVIETSLDEGRQRVLAGVTAGAVTAVVAEGDRFGERHVQSERPADRSGHLRDLESMGQPGPLMIVGKDEDLRLARQAPERRRMEDPVTVSFEAGSGAVWSLLDHPCPCTDAQRRTGTKRRCFDRFSCLALECRSWCDGSGGIVMGDLDAVGAVSPHGGAPECFAFGQFAFGPHWRMVERQLHRPVDPWVRRSLPCRKSTPSEWRVRSLAGVSNFVDECNINVKGGDGGAGCVAFRREAHVAKGGPDGGDGGDGGSIWLVADRNVASLLAFRDHPHRKGESGVHGSGGNRHGARGSDLEVKVPEGTVVLDHASREPLADLLHHGDRWLAAQAGEGGRGNARFLSNKRRAPSFAEQGEHGEERWLRLELKLMADVAIIGFPNVGKSTFISSVSAAKPKIADYPFTTLEPNLGVVRMDDGFEMVLADIPGLIEGASDGKGLGHQFLRHVERARVLLVLLDLAPWDGVSPHEQLEVLLDEIGSYRPDLLDRPRLVVGSRSDLAPDHDFDGPVVSSVTRSGLPSVLGSLSALVREARTVTPSIEAATLHRPLGREISIERFDDGSWNVVGRSAVRAVALSDLTNDEALEFAQARLKQLGVFTALRRAGVTTGDTVHIGDFSFDYEEDE